MCKEAVEKMGEVWTSLGFNASIYFMLLVPMLLIGSFGGFLYLNYKRYSSQHTPKK